MVKKELLLSVTDFDFVNDDGEKVAGANLYLLGPNVQSENIRGHRVAKYFISKDLSRKLSVLPCHAEVEYAFDIKSDGSTQLKVVDLKFLNEYKIS